MNKLNLESDRKRIRIWINKGYSLKSIATVLKIGRNTLRRHLLEMQIAFSHKTGPKKGKLSALWNGGVRLTPSGYVEVFAPWHPACIASNEQRKKKNNDKSYNLKRYMQLHRLVMENHLKRFLLPYEVVHHKDNNPIHNEIENLELFSSNSNHLACELAGKCPKWTPAGRRNLQLSFAARKGIRPGVTLSDVPSYKAVVDHLRKLPQTFRQHPSRKERVLLQKRAIARSKPILKTLIWCPELLDTLGLKGHKSS